MAVAAAVQSGSADAGMGIASAAKAMDLDFIPLGQEEYDFAVLPAFLELKQTKIFLDLLKSRAFQQRLQELGGYTWDKAGEVIYIARNN